VYFFLEGPNSSVEIVNPVDEQQNKKKNKKKRKLEDSKGNYVKNLVLTYLSILIDICSTFTAHL
jgi:hypothetical protein